MEVHVAIEANRIALKRIVAMLEEMAGLAEAPTSPTGASPTSPLWGGRREASGGGCDGPHAEPSQADQSDEIADVPRDPLTASLGSADLPSALAPGVRRTESQILGFRPACVRTLLTPLKGGEEGRPAPQPPTPLPRRPGERWPAERVGEGVDRAVTPTRRPDVRRPPHKGEVKGPTIPRLLWRAICAVLRPAESAARRLIIAAARGLTVPPPPPERQRQPKPEPIDPLYRKLGLAVRFTPGSGTARARLAQRGLSAVAQGAKGDGGAPSEPEATPRIPAFPLSDPPRHIGPPRRRTVPPHAAPRIMFPGIIEPHRCLRRLRPTTASAPRALSTASRPLPPPSTICRARPAALQGCRRAGRQLPPATRKPRDASIRSASPARPAAGFCATTPTRPIRKTSAKWTRSSPTPMRSPVTRWKTPTRRDGEGMPQAPPVIIAAAFSAIIMVGALVLPATSLGITEASTTRRPSTPRTRNCGSTTEASSRPIRQLPAGW